MMFYVYIDPAIIGVARENGTYAIQSLIAVLRGLVQNCCVAVFEDNRTEVAMHDQIDALLEDFDRKQLKALLATLAKRNRFIYVLTPDYFGSQEDLSIVLSNADVVPLDMLILENELVDHLPRTAEVSTLASYQNTNFEIERSRLANEGCTLAEAQMSEREFMDKHLKKALRFAARIDICDRIMGRQFGDNFEHTCRAFLQWLEPLLSDPSRCTLTFHVGDPQNASLSHIRNRLDTFRQRRLSPMKIEIHIYDVPLPDQCLPHERFIFTDQIALEIGRGMDFLDRTSHKNRDISLGYKSPQEVEALLKSYNAYKRQPVTSF